MLHALLCSAHQTTLDMQAALTATCRHVCVYDASDHGYKHHVLGSKAACPVIPHSCAHIPVNVDTGQADIWS